MPLFIPRLFELLPVYQHIVSDRGTLCGDTKQGSEGGVTGSASVETEDELIEIGL